MATDTWTFRTLFRPFRLQEGVWFHVTWADGTTEPETEDYPPWTLVNEMRAGYSTWDVRGEEVTFEVRWLEDEERQHAWERFGRPDSQAPR